MAWLQGVLFLGVGAGLIGVDWLSLSKGSLPCGANGFAGRLLIERARRPALYWALFALYAAGGLALAAFAVRLLLGQAEPLPLR